MPIYRAKLTSNGSPNGVTASTYYNDGYSPYIGYVALSKTIPASGDGASYGIFESSEVKEYLGRCDSEGLLSSSYVVDLDKIYQDSIGEAGEDSNYQYLPCSALGKDLGKTATNGFYHYLKLNDNALSTYKMGLPYSDGDGRNEIMLPYSTNGKSLPLYVNFELVGFSKACTPFVTTGLYLEDGNQTNMSDNISFSAAGEVHGGAAGWSEYPGKSALTTRFAEMLFHGAANGFSTSSTAWKTQTFNNYIHDNYTSFSSAGNAFSSFVNDLYYMVLGKKDYWGLDNFTSDLMPFITAVSHMALTDGDSWYGMYISNYKFTDNYNGYEGRHCEEVTGSKIPSGMMEYADTVYRCSQVATHDTGNSNTIKRYAEYYIGLFNHSSAYYYGDAFCQTEFSKDLYEYYTDHYNPEPIVIDHLTGSTSVTTSVNSYTIDFSKKMSSINTSFYFVARPAGPFISTDAKTTYAKALMQRHTKYITRYDVLGLNGGSDEYGASNTRSANPKYKASLAGIDSSCATVLDAPPTSSVAIFNSGIKKSGGVYVSKVTLHFKGDVETFKKLPSSITVASLDKTISKTFNMSSPTSSTSDTVTYELEFSPSESPSFIQAVESNSNLRPTKMGLNAHICSFHQMVRCNSGIYRLNKYTSYLTSDENSLNAQWTLLKMAGVLSVSLSGRNVYSTSTDNSTDIILKGVEVTLCDNTCLTADLKLGRESNVTISPRGSDYISNFYKGMTESTIKEDAGIRSKTSECVFFNAITGNKRAAQVASYTGQYDDFSVLSSDWGPSTSAHKPSVNSEDNYPVISIGGYGNTLGSSLYTGAAYTKASQCTTATTFTAVTDPINSSISSGNVGVAPANTYYSVSVNLNAGNLGGAFGTSNTLRYALPKPDVHLALDYKSVEFNNASAWTFTRSMPLNAASAAKPHILVYKVEAWVESTDEYGEVSVDPDATATIKISEQSEGADNAHRVYSGYSTDLSTAAGINHAIENGDVLNNIYLKYNDGTTNIYNAVSTKFPIKILDSSVETAVNYYGGDALEYTVKNVTYTSNDATNIQNMYNTISSSISSAVQVCICGCAGSVDSSKDGVCMTKDNHKVFYLGIGFYNDKYEIMPITASFGIELSFKDPATGDTASYPKRISLNEFFPKDSMIYMAGMNANTTSDNDHKIKFIKGYAKTGLSGTGNRIVSRTGSTVADAPVDNEAVNIGAGVTKCTDTKTGEINSTSIDYSGGKVLGLYGIFNKRTGEINYISTGSSNITKAGLSDIVTAAESEGYEGAYNDYVNFMDSVAGKCLTESQNLCLFEHCTDKDVPYIL